MHRTTTTAALLLSVTVSALSGCVRVERSPAYGPPPAAARAETAQPNGRSEPQIVQAPAREALQQIRPSRRPAPRPATPTAPAQPSAPASRTAAPQASPAHRMPPAAERPSTAHPERPSMPRRADVCALGRRYGGWRPGSPESAICEHTYGR
ncbi:hypothetical protein ACWCP6_35885 [Streptomyces sp. NPDC002004]